jgi:thiol peroxidase
MSIERKGLINFSGQDMTVVGPDIKAGQLAPEFTVQRTDWSTINALESTHGKVRIIAAFLSISTSVCDRETRRFNEEASELGEDIVIMTLSMDLPFTLKNWCGSAGVDRVMTLSDHMTGEFGEKYGVLLKEMRFFRRAIFVVDRQGKVVYADYMPVLGEEPKYSEVIAAAKAALG